MNPKKQNSLLLAAIVSGLIALPLPWMTIHNAQLMPEVGGFPAMSMQLMTLDVNGFNGSFTLLVKLPIWFVVCIAVGASAIQLLRQTQSFEVPKNAEWLMAWAGIIWTAGPLVALFTGRVTPGIGWLLGLFCSAVPLYCLMTASSSPTRSTTASSSQSPPQNFPWSDPN
jgi:hypothetical protein